MPEKEGSPDFLENMSKHITEASKFIEEEYKSSTNTWPKCVGSMVAVLGFDLYFIEQAGLMSAEELQHSKQNLEKLNNRNQELMKQYKTRDSEIPQETKDEIYQLLNITQS